MVWKPALDLPFQEMKDTSMHGYLPNLHFEVVTIKSLNGAWNIFTWKKIFYCHFDTYCILGMTVLINLNINGVTH